MTAVPRLLCKLSITNGGMRLAPASFNALGERGSAKVTLHGLAVLVIEDVSEIRDAFVSLLRADGANAIGAGTGREALAMASRQRFDAVLSDLDLPDISGDVVIRAILASATAPIRIVVVSGADALQLNQAREAGADAVFQKPVEWATVVRYLDEPGLQSAA
jgi:CheY-like chemotaxis protein